MTPRVLRTTRNLPKETVGLERLAGKDGQGLPAYAPAVTFQGNVLEYDTAMRGDSASQFVVGRDGSRILTPLTIYVEGDETEIADEQDRVRLLDGRPFIVAEKKPVSGLRYSRMEPDHFRLRCRTE